jgi:hypothetical protein
MGWLGRCGKAEEEGRRRCRFAHLTGMNDGRRRRQPRRQGVAGWSGGHGTASCAVGEIALAPPAPTRWNERLVRGFVPFKFPTSSMAIFM